MLETYAALHYVAPQHRSFDVADETKVEGKIEAVAKAAEAPVKAVAEKAEVVAAPAVVNTPVIETKPVAKAKPKAKKKV